MDSVHDTDITKTGYKAILKESCFEKDEKDMRERMASMSKCDSIIKDEFKVQEYMKSNSLSYIREIFRIKTRMNHLRGNFSGDPKYRGEAGMVCVGCGFIKETNYHVTECDVYADLLVGKDLSDDRDLVSPSQVLQGCNEKEGVITLGGGESTVQQDSLTKFD